MDTGLVLDASGLSKSFGPTRALRDASLQVAAGEAHGLVGENGAGKSTLLKLLTGVVRPDAGRMRLCGQPFQPRDPEAARLAGLCLVPQELRVVPAMTVADNILLGRWPIRRRFAGLLPGALDRHRGFDQASAALARLSLAIDLRALMRTLSFAESQAVVLARAIATEGARLLILDEPTASLERGEVDRLFGLLDRMRAHGTAVIFVSHRLDEVARLCDRVSVMRDGAVAARHVRGGYTQADLAQGMTGRALEMAPPGGARVPGAELLALVGEPQPGDAIAVRAGQVTGLAGLLGAGTGPLLRRAFDGTARGIRVRGASVRPDRPAGTIALGIGYVPSERGGALVASMSVRDNIVLPHLRRLTRTAGSFDACAADRLADSLVARLDIRPADTAASVGSLSGGNQQKVLFARWLAGQFHTLLLDEPAHGIDISAKQRVFRLIDEFVAGGGGVLLASAELNELMAHADEIVGLRGGAVCARLQRGQPGFTEATLRRVLGG